MKTISDAVVAAATATEIWPLWVSPPEEVYSTVKLAVPVVEPAVTVKSQPLRATEMRLETLVASAQVML